MVISFSYKRKCQTELPQIKNAASEMKNALLGSSLVQPQLKKESVNMKIIQ